MIDVVQLSHIVLLFFAGTLIGSFCNVVGIRIPAGKSIVMPRSSCMSCGTQLHYTELIPVLGWLLNRGRCRYCKQPVSGIYLFGELAGGFLFALLPYLIAEPRELILAYPMAALLIALTVADLKHRLIPNKLMYPALIFFFLLRLLIHPLPYYSYGLGFVLGGGSLLAVSWFFALRGKDGMGGGDIKLMALMGMIMGAKLVFICLLVSALLGSVTGSLLILAGKLEKENAYLPYGPFIAAGGLCALFFGDPLASWYMGLFH
ncbi:A24 family peptidase [Paenibacillus sp. YN15]|uniref:prepilin peptidase n=1 Tax=Paenibacillus sp. YN15 TaxID=1742774 RepID=UPI000DCE94A8|nr:A24 family peptidase [Paenibacillus sp. YN15]RAV03504.1 prepilin peptidase [Paenibacillus sp. YN15]